MDRENILEKVEQCIKDISLGKITSVDHTDRIEEDLSIDSMSTTELAFSIEDNFKINISDSELFKLKTVDDIIDLIIIKNETEMKKMVAS